MRRLEFKDATSQKFWELELEGDSFTVRYGRLGSQGQTKTKTFASADEAKRQGEKTLLSKLKKGYIEVATQSASASPSASPTGRQALEAAIFDNPHDTAAWQVYGDWLQQQNDPHGELISLGLQRASAGDAVMATLDERIAEIEDEHLNQWLGGAAELLAQETDNELATLRWEHGYVHTLVVGQAESESDESRPKPEDLLAAMVEAPAFLFLRTVTIGFTYDDGDWQGCTGPSLRAMCAGKLDALTRLTIADLAYDWDISSTSVGVISDVLPVAPRLRTLDVRGNEIVVDRFEHATLESVRFETGGLPGESAAAIARCKLPAVKKLVVYFGSSDYGGSSTIDHILPLLSGTGVPKLEHLALCNAEFQNEIAEQIAPSPLLQQLRSLDMSQGTMNNTGARTILSYAKNFAHLEQMDLSNNFISDALCAQLKAALPNVELNVSYQEGADEDEDEAYYYVSVSE